MKTWHRPLMVMVVAMALLVVAALVGLVVDDRKLLGESVWVKPLKFGLAFVVYGATLAWMLSEVRKARKTMWAMGTVFAITGVIDVGFIVVQAARGTYSHFNANDDSFDAIGQLVFSSGIVGLFGASLVIAIVLLRQRVGDAALTWALRLGLGVAAIGMGLGYGVVGANTAGERHIPDAEGNPVTMAGGHGDAAAPDGNGMPLTNWSIDGGDMRVPHFFGLHAVQVLLVAVLLLALLSRRVAWLRGERVQARLIGVVAFGYTGFMSITTLQVLRGQSLVKPDLLTVAVFAALVVATLAAAWWVVRRSGGEIDAAAEARRTEPVAADRGRR